MTVRYLPCLSESLSLALEALDCRFAAWFQESGRDSLLYTAELVVFFEREPSYFHAVQHCDTVQIRAERRGISKRFRPETPLPEIVEFLLERNLRKRLDVCGKDLYLQGPR